MNLSNASVVYSEIEYVSSSTISEEYSERDDTHRENEEVKNRDIDVFPKHNENLPREQIACEETDGVQLAIQNSTSSEIECDRKELSANKGSVVESDKDAVDVKSKIDESNILALDMNSFLMEARKAHKKKKSDNPIINKSNLLQIRDAEILEKARQVTKPTTIPTENAEKSKNNGSKTSNVEEKNPVKRKNSFDWTSDW